MILLREKLAKLLAWQDMDIVYDTLDAESQKEYLVKADEIIELFTDAIKNLEFEAPKHYHEKINSAFIFPPCKSFKGEFKA